MTKSFEEPKGAESSEKLEDWEKELCRAVWKFDGLEGEPNEQEVSEYIARIKKKWEDSKKPIREILSYGWIDETDPNFNDFAKKWEAKYGTTSAAKIEAQRSEEQPVTGSEKVGVDLDAHEQGDAVRSYIKSETEKLGLTFKEVYLYIAAEDLFLRSSNGRDLVEKFFDRLDNVVTSLSSDPSISENLHHYSLEISTAPGVKVVEGNNIVIGTEALLRDNVDTKQVAQTIAEQIKVSTIPKKDVHAKPEVGQKIADRRDFWTAKTGEWQTIFRKAEISDQAENWAVSESGPGTEQFLQEVDKFIDILSSDPEIESLLQGYRLYIHSGELNSVIEGNIRVSARDIMDKGAAATAEMFVPKIREQMDVPPQTKETVSTPVADQDEAGNGPEVGQEGEQEQHEEPLGSPEVSARGNNEVPPGDSEEEQNESENPKDKKEDSELLEGLETSDGGDYETFPGESSHDNMQPAENLHPHNIYEPFDLRNGEMEDSPRWRERVTETASRLAERFGIKNIVDSVKIAYSYELAGWHTGRAMSLKEQLGERKDKIRNLKEDRRNLEDQIRKFRAEGEVSEAALTRIEKERAKTERDAENNKNAADRLRSKLEYRNNQRARYEHRRNAVCEGFMGRVQERLAPFDEKLSDLKLTRDQLVGEIGQHRTLLADQQAKIAVLKKRIDAEEFSSVRRAHREILRKIERETKDVSAEITARENDCGKIEKKIITQNKKANPWRDKYNRLARITQYKGPDTNVAPRRGLEEGSFELRDVSDHSRAESERDNLDGRGDGPVRPEFAKVYAADDLISAWNKKNGSRMKINPEVAQEEFPDSLDGPMSVDDFWRFTEFYAERHGDQERFEGMPSMQKAARKRKGRGFWARLFGIGNRAKSQHQFLDFLSHPS